MLKKQSSTDKNYWVLALSLVALALLGYYLTKNFLLQPMSINRIDEATPTPSPKATPKNSPKATQKSTPKPSVKPTPKDSSLPKPSYLPKPSPSVRPL